MIRPRLITEDIKMALETIRTHKVRSFLTVLGVVIGVSVAIAVASILLGVEKSFQDSLNAFGIDNLFITRFDPGIHIGNFSADERLRKPLTYDDGMAIKEEAPAIKEVTVEAVFNFSEGPQPIRTARNKNHELVQIVFRGATATYTDTINGILKSGRFFTELEDLHRADVVVLGFDAAKSLFPDEDPVGKQLLVDGNFYSVIGVFAKKKSTLNAAGDVEVIIPFRTYVKRYPQDTERIIIAMAYPGMKVAADEQVRTVLRTRRRVPPNKPDSFGISTAEQISNQFNDILRLTFQLVVGVVSIGLLVGGVGVMNIMLMSVTERTREIGVRKAIGARKRDISLQFITEAVTLTGAGGVLGVLLSFLFSFLLSLVHFPSSVPMWAVVIAVAVSCSVGLFFGIYPAMKAARLDPVIALRYE
jgi:ABC-type antimicrobial peptide transport system permease subunit